MDHFGKFVRTPRAECLSAKRVYPNPRTVVAKALAINEFIAFLPNGVIIPNHPFLGIRNGQTTPQFHTMAYNDAVRGGIRGLNLPEYLEKGGAEWAILSGNELAEVRGWIFQRYEPSNEASLPSLVGYLPDPVVTMTGRRSGPRQILRLRRDPTKSGTHRIFDLEHSGLSGWVFAGDAFGNRTGETESGTVNSYDRRLRDAATGTALSPCSWLTADTSGFSSTVGVAGAPAWN